MATELDDNNKNRDIIRRYFAEVVDGRSDHLDAIFTGDCIIHRPELREPLRGLDQLQRFLQMARLSIRETHTTIHALVAEGDQVAARVSHRATFASQLMTPWGRKDVAGRSVEWTAMALFRCRDGRIAEEWVHRDEVGVWRQLGFFDRGS